MRVIKPFATIETPVSGLTTALQAIESAGRTCYKSEDFITDESAEKFVRMITKRGHLSVIEHVSVSVRFVTNRGVTHEIVRHRLAAYSQESSRYCNYVKEKFGNEITFIEPWWWEDETVSSSWRREIWNTARLHAEKAYFEAINDGMKPDAARDLLPNGLKTEIVMTCNLREWLHVFRMRTAKAAHPDMRRVMVPLLAEFKKYIPVIFDEVEGYE